MLTKQEILLGRAPGWRAVGKGTQENSSDARLAVLRFMVMGFVSGWLWPIILIQSLSWWHTHCSAKMDASERDSGKWTERSLLDLSQTLLAGGGLLVPYFLSGFPVIKQLRQMVTMVPGQGGPFQSVCFP